MGKKKQQPVQTRVVNKRAYTIVVPIFDEEHNNWLVETALHLARPRNGRVVLVGAVLVPPGESLSAGTAQAQARRTELEKFRQQYAGQPVHIKPRIRVVHQPWRALAEVIAAEQARLVILSWHPQGTETSLAIDLDELIGHLNCHAVVVSGKAPEQLNNILLPIRGSQEAPLTLEVALSLAKATGAKITMLYATHNDSPKSQQIYKELARMSQGNPYIGQQLQVSSKVMPAILDQLDRHDLVVMGAAEAAPGHPARAVGRIPRQLRLQEDVPFMVVRTYVPPPLMEMGRWNRPEPLPPTQTSVMVDRWFAENTFNSQEFRDVKRLVEMKEAQGVTISLGLPALNEEETIGKIIKTIKTALMVKAPLLDEIVLIDSGSTDRTAEIARDQGIPVVQHSDILPQYGTVRGKGEALWKSLYALKGDLIAWIDTDIVNIHPRFVYGILGPLLRHSKIQYVKGFYRRPLKVGNTYQAGGGGRVTELVARPLFNLFYPELSGIVQPLAGEYAGRRAALERTPFYAGYGVETGLLLNLVERYGISGIAQVDLRRRIHRNQTLTALSRMSFAIIQVFIDHLEKRQKVELLSEVNRTMKIIRYEMDTYMLKEHPISDRLRPPIITIPEYRARHNITGWEETDYSWRESAAFKKELAA